MCSHLNNRLQKYCKLEKTYNLITKQAFYAFKKGDEKCTILETYKKLSPMLDSNAIPDSRLVKEQINTYGEKELERLRKKLVPAFIENS